MKFPLPCLAPLAPLTASGAEHRVNSPDGRLALVVSDEAGLRYRVELDGRPVLADSKLGLEFADGLVLGPSARITGTRSARHDGTWENAYSTRRHVPDNWRELSLTLRESVPAVVGAGSAGAGKAAAGRVFGLVARVYDDGVAFRYELPAEFVAEEFTLARPIAGQTCRSTAAASSPESRPCSPLEPRQHARRHARGNLVGQPARHSGVHPADQGPGLRKYPNSGGLPPFPAPPSP